MSAAAQSWPEAREAIRELGASGYTEAAESIRAAIPLLNTAESGDTDQLVDVWIALGKAYAANDLHELAVDAYENAVDVSRQELGLLNERQVDIRWLQSQAALAGGDGEAAARYREESRSIAIRSRRGAVNEIGSLNGIDSREYFVAMLAHARWLAEQNEWTEARLAYNEILGVLGDETDEDPEPLVRILQEMASKIGFPSSSFVPLDGDASPGALRPAELDRAAETLDRMEDADSVLQAAVLRDTADWALNLGSVTKAKRGYWEALELLDGIEGGEELTREWFDAPVFLQHRWIVGAVSVLRSDPEWMADIAVAHFRASRFRPRIVEGEPVDSEVGLSWTFRYDSVVAWSLGH